MRVSNPFLVFCDGGRYGILMKVFVSQGLDPPDRAYLGHELDSRDCLMIELLDLDFAYPSTLWNERLDKRSFIPISSHTHISKQIFEFGFGSLGRKL